MIYSQGMIHYFIKHQYSTLHLISVRSHDETFSDVLRIACVVERRYRVYCDPNSITATRQMTVRGILRFRACFLIHLVYPSIGRSALFQVDSCRGKTWLYFARRLEVVVWSSSRDHECTCRVLGLSHPDLDVIALSNNWDILPAILYDHFCHIAILNLIIYYIAVLKR